MSLERAKGFEKTINGLQKELSEVLDTPAIGIKFELVESIKEDIQLFQQMYQVESDIINGYLERKPPKFKLSKDGFTYEYNMEVI